MSILIEKSFSHLKINIIFNKISRIVFGKHELFNYLKIIWKPYEILLEDWEIKNYIYGRLWLLLLYLPMITSPTGYEIELNVTK